MSNKSVSFPSPFILLPTLFFPQLLLTSFHLTLASVVGRLLRYRPYTMKPAMNNAPASTTSQFLRRRSRLSPPPSGAVRSTGAVSSSSSVSHSPSRTSLSAPVPRALRLFRLLFYSIAAPNFLYSLYVQLVVLKGPGRTPLPASMGFGRDTLFLTFHGNFHCTWYACLCFLHALLSFPKSKRRPRSYAARTIEWASHRFTALLFPLAAFVGLAYYLILHYHPLNRMRAQLVPDHDEKMALLHLNPLLFVLGDSWLKDADLLVKHGFKKRRATSAIIIYGICYFTWTLFCTRLNGGHWPYPFQKSFSVMQHVMFVLASLLFSAYLSRLGFRLHGRLDRRRRRRLAVAAGMSSTSASHMPTNYASAPPSSGALHRAPSDRISTDHVGISPTSAYPTNTSHLHR